MERQRRRFTIRGRVQGVNFRWSCREMAGQLDLSGWVRNRRDGSVEVVAEGTEASLADFMTWCGHGPPHAHVTDVEEHAEPPQNEVGFDIRY